MRVWPQEAGLGRPRCNISQQRGQGPELPHREDRLEALLEGGEAAAATEGGSAQPM